MPVVPAGAKHGTRLSGCEPQRKLGPTRRAASLPNRGGLTVLVAGTARLHPEKASKSQHRPTPARPDNDHKCRPGSPPHALDTMLASEPSRTPSAFTSSSTAIAKPAPPRSVDCSATALGTACPSAYSRTFVVADNHIRHAVRSALESTAPTRVARNLIESSGHGLEAKRRERSLGRRHHAPQLLGARCTTSRHSMPPRRIVTVVGSCSILTTVDNSAATPSSAHMPTLHCWRRVTRAWWRTISSPQKRLTSFVSARASIHGTTCR